MTPTPTTRIYRALWRTRLGRALCAELDQAHTDMRGALHGYNQARREIDTLTRQLLCAGELITQRDAQYAALVARLRNVEDARDILEQELQAMTDGLRWFAEGSGK